MAVEGEDAEYVSDPEDAVLPSVRRRAASDDEEDGRQAALEPSDRKGGGGPDSEGEGGAPYEEEEYDEEEVEYEEEGEEGEYEEDDLLEEEEEEGGRYEERAKDGGDKGEAVENDKDKGREREKEMEPFVVPKAGPFYMHDDRFRENRGFRGRRTPGGHKLWDSKDDRAWMHDKFEEMNMEDLSYEQGRNFRGHYRGRGKSRGAGCGYGRGRKDHTHDNRYRNRDDRTRPYSDKSHNSSERSRAYSDGGKPHLPKIVRGRGPRRYEPLMKNKEMSVTHTKQFVDTREPVLRSTVIQSPNNSTQQSRSVPPQKQVFMSSLNSASPPFYPSGASNQDYSVISKRDVQMGTTTTKIAPRSVEDDTGPSSKGKAVGYSGHENILLDNSCASGKNMNNSQLQWSSSSPVNASQQSQVRAPGRDFHVAGQSSYHHGTQLNKPVKESSIAQPPIQQRPTYGPVQQQPMLLSQNLVSGAVASSPHIHTKNSSEVNNSEAPNALPKSKPAASVKDRTTNSQSAGSASLLYGGTPIIGPNGTMGLAHGTQGFAGTPTLVPVMQFCGQNPGGLGVPAVGLALPGYVAQSQPGFGNSEMTWMPALASAGALGAPYGPYFAIEGGYYAHPSSQVSSTSRDGSANQLVKPSKSPQNSGTASDDTVQRQNKPRRYSEMNFGQ